MNKKKKLGISYLIDLMIISKVGFIPRNLSLKRSVLYYLLIDSLYIILKKTQRENPSTNNITSSKKQNEEKFFLHQNFRLSGLKKRKKNEKIFH